MLAFVDLISLHVFHLLPKTEGHAAVHAGGSVRGVQPEGPHHAVLYSSDWSYLGETLLHPISGADPGFWERGGYGRGRAPSRDSKGVWGSADSSPSGVWGEAPAAFLLLRLFTMKFTVIQYIYITRYQDY